MSPDFFRDYANLRLKKILATEGVAQIALWGQPGDLVVLDGTLDASLRQRIRCYVSEPVRPEKAVSRPCIGPGELPAAELQAIVFVSESAAHTAAATTTAPQLPRLILCSDILESDFLQARRTPPAPPAPAKPADRLSEFLFTSRPAADINWQNPFDIMRVAQLKVAFDAAAFVEEHMPDFHYSVTKDDVLRYAVGQAVQEGLYLEFGVHKGRTLNLIASLTQNTVFGFDSFEGLPDAWGFIMDKGTFATGGRPPDGLAANTRTVPGWFDQTLPGFLEAHPENCSFVHIDCDIYSSAVTILEALRPRLVSGTIIVFDDYFNYVGWREHIHKAFTEFSAKFGVRSKFLTFASSHCSVAVRILAVDQPAPPSHPLPLC